MTSLLLLLLIFMVLTPGEPFQDSHDQHFRKMHEETALSEHEPCHFPFRFQREMHHSCILSHSIFNKHWCATTENYDRDGKWRYCGKEERPGGHCDPNPCQNGGNCEARRMGFHCICAAGFHGRHCEKENCFGTKGLLHIGRKDTWVRNQPTGPEECHCARKKLFCKPMHGKACATNPCMNGGRCLEVKHNLVCSCPEGFSGPLCDIEHTQTCYRDNGRLYRGMAHYTVSGAPCLPWDSPLLLNEYSSSVSNASDFGLGPHAFCRNPDGDSQPWCYVLRDMQLSWEFCNITSCHPQYTDIMAPPAAVPPLAPLETNRTTTKKPENIRPTTGPTQTAFVPAPVCGLRFPKTTTSSRSRIVRGMVALRGSHPYMAAIYLGDQFCGGSLIASCWVLTAAHCLEFRQVSPLTPKVIDIELHPGPDVSKISVVLGQTQYNRSTDGSVKFQVQNYLLHEHYSEITKRHDIALVRLKEKAPGQCAELSHSILPVCLPNSAETFDTSKPCQIAGWGHMYEGASKLSVYLQEADMPIIPHEQCRSQEVHGTNIAEDMLCAGYMDGRADACQGDSGGPLVCDEQGKATLRGIISWGTGCALENKPGVYTSVTHYLDWIQNHMH